MNDERNEPAHLPECIRCDTLSDTLANISLLVAVLADDRSETTPAADEGLDLLTQICRECIEHVRRKVERLETKPPKPPPVPRKPPSGGPAT